jgi:pyridoxal phosphate enzyme (YggS family)
MSPIAARYQAVLDRIAAAADAAGRDPSSVTLLCVSKKHDPAAIRAAHDAGARWFGENYVQEWAKKANDPSVSALPGLRWSFVGHLQSNKAKQLVGRAEIESVDGAPLLALLSRLAASRGARQDVFLQVNLGLEASKSGLTPDGVADLVKASAELPGVRIRGLMHIPPPMGDPRLWHRALRALRDRVEDDAAVELPELSMGMSDDLEAAIAEGATRVRIGTAIFGPR